MTAVVGILGGGISGLALAAHLKRPFELLEASSHLGGLCASVLENGFTFDAAGPHIMFSKNQQVLARMVEVLGRNVHRRRRRNKIWFKGRIVKYPFENGLSDLSPEDRFECILGYLQNPWDKPPQNLEEWAYATFGKGISEKYFLPYNRKIWNVEPAEITLEWVARIPKPPLEDVLKSAIGIPTEGYLHQLNFYYPREGGFEALVHSFERLAGNGKILTGCPALRVSGKPGAWVVETPKGSRHYETLVSTLPIHELAAIWNGLPAAGRAALAQLRYNGLINVLLGLKEHPGCPITALYVPDAKSPFHRLSFPKNFSKACVPEGHFSIMAEITARAEDAVWKAPDGEILQSTVAHLHEMGLLHPAALVYSKVVRFVYGYPIYDHAYFASVAALRGAVASRGIHLLGRFAQFDYINSDVCVERAQILAEELNHAE
jgi:protoporphyrinogen oxidase